MNKFPLENNNLIFFWKLGKNYHLGLIYFKFIVITECEKSFFFIRIENLSWQNAIQKFES